MNVLHEVEALFPQATSVAQAAWKALVAEEKYLAALIAKDAKVVAGVLDTQFASMLPAAVTALKAEALACVKSLEGDPSFKNAIGSWKFGTACTMLLRAVESGIIPSFTAASIKTLGTAAIETAIQAAVAALLVA